MNKGKINGWQDVFKFTYIQSVKSKSMKVIEILLFTIALLSLPFITLISGDGSDKETQVTFTKVYVAEENIEVFDKLKDILASEEKYANVEFVKDTRSYDDIKSDLKDAKADSSEAAVYISYSKPTVDMDIDSKVGIAITGIYGDNTEVSKSDMTDIGEYLEVNVLKAYLQSQNIDESKIELYSAEVNTDVTILDNAGNVVTEDDTDLNGAEYGFSYALVMITIMLMAFSGGAVASSIVTEKSTRVVEYLLVVVKPMAIIVGKVLGTLLVILTEFAVAIAGFVASIVLNSVMNSSDGIVIPEFISNTFNSEIFKGIVPLNILIALLIFITGFIFYGLIAGVAGAAVSKMEEMAEGVKIYSFIMIIGAYLAMFLTISQSSGGDWGSVDYLVYLLPISSVFIIPGYLLIGHISLGIALLALLINVISVVLLLLFVSKVYEHMIMYRGTPLKLKDIINIFKTNKNSNGKGVKNND